MQKAFEAAPEDVRASLRLLHRDFDQAAALGRPGVGRGKSYEKTRGMRTIVAAAMQMFSASRLVVDRIASHG